MYALFLVKDLFEIKIILYVYYAEFQNFSYERKYFLEPLKYIYETFLFYTLSV